MSDIRDRLLRDLTRKLADEGRLIEAGWVALYRLALPPDASAIQVREMRNAYMAGAQHMWASIFTMLDDGDEATKGDIARLDLISAEMNAFASEVKEAAKRGSW